VRGMEKRLARLEQQMDCLLTARLTSPPSPAGRSETEPTARR
jgi:hypothetical protein